MKRILFLIAGLIVVSSCGDRTLFSKHGDYLGGNKEAAIELACRKRGGMAKDSGAYDLCIQSQRIHYK